MSFTGNLRFAEPPQPEVQATQSDITMLQTSQMLVYLRDIRNELCKQNPDVLCQTDIQGGPTITATATDNKDQTIKFLVGGKPVTVYKTYLWTNSAKAIRCSITGMSSGADGFVIPATPFVIETPISELAISLNVAGVIGVNVPSGLNADGSVFIYGFTIPDRLNYREPY